MTIACGTSGSCTWSISDAGALTVRPTSGTSGVLYRELLTLSPNPWPWKDYVASIKTAAFSGAIQLGYDFMGEKIDGSAYCMFRDCTSLTAVSGLSSLRDVTGVPSMFWGCSSLATLDLTGFSTTDADAGAMFTGCDVLSSVTFGNAFSIKADGFSTGFVAQNKACENTTTGTVVTSDDAFRALTAAERAGTWTRGVDASFKATAERSTGGVADEDGEDVTFSVTWSTDATTTARTLTIYQKAASASSYPSTPAYTATLTGDSGTVAPTLSNVGDDAYDFKVKFYDGTNTFIAYPSVQSNIRLLTLDEQGNGVFLGSVTATEFIAPVNATTSDIIDANTSGGWTIVSATAKRWGKICALTVTARKNAAITLPVTGDIDNQFIGTLRDGYRPADYAPGMCWTYPGFAVAYTDGELRWLTATPRASAGTVAANSNVIFRIHYMLS